MFADVLESSKPGCPFVLLPSKVKRGVGEAFVSALHFTKLATSNNRASAFVSCPPSDFLPFSPHFNFVSSASCFIPIQNIHFTRQNDETCRDGPTETSKAQASPRPGRTRGKSKAHKMSPDWCWTQSRTARSRSLDPSIMPDVPTSTPRPQSHFLKTKSVTT